ncbi:MAG: hypothetical protein F9K44_06665 [Hyphomicrobiaceae bacterium]|nr:MAG: hypothetical protein F9K44_06665 [Hyphomicrobiaceae bacterium]
MATGPELEERLEGANPTPAEVAEYLHELIGNLAAIAQSAGLLRVAEILETASYEVEPYLKGRCNS